MSTTEISTAVGAKLDSVAWDFTDLPTRTGMHGIHPYPAKFIPQIPRYLIELFHPGNDSPVLDPFCGSGTTLVEAAECGLPAIGIDINPLATLIAKAKTTPFLGDLGRWGTEVCAAAKRRLAHGKTRIPPIPRLDHWFKEPIQQALAALVGEINALGDGDLADALRVAFSSIVVRVSNQESDTRYAAIEKKVTQEDVWTYFERAASSIGVALTNSWGGLFRHRPRVRLINADLMTVQPEDIGKSIGLVITSPPYPNAYEYWLYHKYRMYWLAMDPIPVREGEIGARAHYFKKRRQTEADFERQMGICFRLLSNVMAAGAYACFVVGRSIIHGRRIDNQSLLDRAAAPHGFRQVGSIQRNIALTRKSFNLAHGTINREGIVVFLLETP